jgi:hypothetical protein
LLSFYNSHSNWNGIMLWFWFVFLWWLVMLIIFHILVSHLYILFWEISIQVIHPFLNGYLFSVLLLLSCLSSLYILEMNLLLDINLQIFWRLSLYILVWCNLICQFLLSGIIFKIFTRLFPIFHPNNFRCYI